MIVGKDVEGMTVEIESPEVEKNTGREESQEKGHGRRISPSPEDTVMTALWKEISLRRARKQGEDGILVVVIL